MCRSFHNHANSHFISHLKLVKHYHSIIVNLKTMKSSGSSFRLSDKIPIFIDPRIVSMCDIKMNSFKLIRNNFTNRYGNKFSNKFATRLSFPWFEHKKLVEKLARSFDTSTLMFNMFPEYHQAFEVKDCKFLVNKVKFLAQFSLREKLFKTKFHLWNISIAFNNNFRFPFEIWRRTNRSNSFLALWNFLSSFHNLNLSFIEVKFRFL